LTESAPVSSSRRIASSTWLGRRIGDVDVVGRDHDAVDRRAAPSCLHGARDERHAADALQVLARDALRAAASWHDGQHTQRLLARHGAPVFHTGPTVEQVRLAAERMLRDRLVLGVLALWLAVSVVRLGRLTEPAEAPPGQESLPALEFFRAQIPQDAGYLFVLPGEFGSDTGLGPRLRYELYPRVYDDVRASLEEHSVRDVIRRENLRYVVVVDAAQYPPTHWTRTPRDWLRRIDLDATRYVLEVVS
jgi:hypothetical protein